MTTISPMMQEYLNIKKQLNIKTLLFFNLGDFYECFFDDAKIVSKSLGLSLTSRKETPMCAVWAKNWDETIMKLAELDHVVALLDYDPLTKQSSPKSNIV
jgi:DNA mismatch repair protein MutS